MACLLRMGNWSDHCLDDHQGVDMTSEQIVIGQRRFTANAREIVIADYEPIDDMISRMNWEKKFRRIQKIRQARGITSYYDDFGTQRGGRHESTR